MKDRPCRACKYCGAHLDPDGGCGRGEHEDREWKKEDIYHDNHSSI